MPLGKKYQLALSQHRSIYTPPKLGECTPGELHGKTKPKQECDGDKVAKDKWGPHCQADQNRGGKKYNLHPFSVRQVSLPITTVIIPGIAILLKK